MSLRLYKAVRTAFLMILLAMLFASGCAPKAYSISGTITGDIVEGVAVYIADSPAFATTDAAGKYSIPNLVGTKKVVPQKEGYVFTPVERTVSGPSTTVDFVSSEIEELPYDVSGTITGVGISGVTINVLGKAISTTSNSTGHYSFTGLTGSNILVPSKSGYTYSPTQITVTGASTNANFVGSAAGGGSSIAMISGGGGHALAILDDGTVVATGANGRGQLGNGDNEDSEVPVPVTGLSGVTVVSCGGAHSAAISDGDLYTWGANSDGQLGHGGTSDALVPTKVTSVMGVDWAYVSCGERHTIAVTTAHVVYTWGSNQYGQLGRIVDETHPADLPGIVDLTGFEPAVPDKVYAGYSHSLILRAGGGMLAFGTNYYGELGAGYTSSPRTTPVEVLIMDVDKVTAGYFHTIVQKSSGELYEWGYNWQGQLGDGTTDDCATPKHLAGFDNALDFAAKGDSSFVVKSDGTLWAWGKNSSSYLGVNSTDIKILNPTQVANVSDIVNVYGGYDFTFGLESSGKMWGWGNNYSGQLGDGSWTPRPLPVQLTW